MPSPERTDVEANIQTVEDEAGLSTLVMNLNVWNRTKTRLINKYGKVNIYLAIMLLLVFLLVSMTLMIQMKFLSQDVQALKTKIKPDSYKFNSQQDPQRRLAYYALRGSLYSPVREFSDLKKEEMVNSESESSMDDPVPDSDLTLNSDFYSNQEAFRSASDRSVDRKNDTVKTNDSTSLNGITTSLTVFENSIVDPAKQNASCNGTTCEMQNRTARDAAIAAGDNELSLERESRRDRLRRDEGRGKKRRKNKRRPNRSRRRLGPLVATFIGAVPEQCIMNSALIGPWIKKREADENSQYDLVKFHLVEKSMAIEITTDGLYSVSAQIFYFGELRKNSYWILLSSEGSKPRQLVKCATTTSNVATEVSCYASINVHVKRGDRLYIEQQERDRLINLREGYSYIQLVLLANDAQQERFT